MGSYAQTFSQTGQHTLLTPELESFDGALAAPESLATAQGSAGVMLENSSGSNINQTITGYSADEVSGLVGQVMENRANEVDSIVGLADNSLVEMAGLAESNFDSIASLAGSTVSSMADVAGNILNTQNRTAEIFAEVTNSVIENKEKNNEIMAGFARDVTGQLADNTMSETGQFSELFKGFGVFVIAIAGVGLLWRKMK